MLALITRRFNTFLLVLIALMAASIIAIVASRAGAGPLDPPAPPASTDSIRLPGTPVSTLGAAIGAPGYYYVTRSIVGAPVGCGITISASNVTLDLGGFTIDGSGGGCGIGVFGVDNVSIRNGTVRGYGLSIDALSGGTTHVHVDNVRALGANSLNTAIRLGDQSTVSNCVVEGGGTGVQVGTDSVVKGCWIRNTGTGINAIGNNDDVTDNFVFGASGCAVVTDGAGTRVEGNHASYSGSGFCTSGGGAIANVFTHNFARGNGADYTDVNAVSNELGPVQNAAVATSPWANVQY